MKYGNANPAIGGNCAAANSFSSGDRLPRSRFVGLRQEREATRKREGCDIALRRRLTYKRVSIGRKVLGRTVAVCVVPEALRGD